MKTKTVVEVVLSYISLGWAITLFTNDHLFEAGGSWGAIKAIAPYEWLVGSVALVCALTKIVGMLMRNRKIRMIGLWMSTLFWVTIAAGMLMANGYPEFTTGFVVYSGTAILALFTAKEVGTDGNTDQ